MSTDLVVREARARAGRIRDGIHNYLTTLTEIAKAWSEGDWRTLGYADWSAYVDGEFGAQRLRLPTEHRQKAVTELRLAGMSTRAIGATVGTSEATVRRDLEESTASFDAVDLPKRVTSLDGRERPASRPEPARSPLAEAMTGVIEEVAEAMANHLPPDDPWRGWRASYLRDIAAAYKVISLQTPDEVAERADTECVEEFRRLVRELGGYADRLTNVIASKYGDNVIAFRSAQ